MFTSEDDDAGRAGDVNPGVDLDLSKLKFVRTFVSVGPVLAWGPQLYVRMTIC